jgi:hypothetical protein
MKKNAFALMVVAGLAGSAMASSVTTTFTSYGTATFTNKNSVGSQGNVLNGTGTWTATSGGTVNAIRVNGNLTDGGLGTYASEARVRMTAGAGNTFAAFNLGAATATSGFSGTLAIGPTQLAVTPFSLAAGDVNFEWFESYNDGGDGIDSTWDDVSYEFGNGSSTVVNGNFALGTLPSDGSLVAMSGSHVSGGLDFYTFTIPAGVTNIGDYLSIRTSAGTINDTEFGLYDSLGNFVATDDDGAVGSGFYSQFSYGTADPFAEAGVTANANPGENGATLAGGTYTLVVAGYNSVFGATIGEITPGTAVGTYELSVNYVPAPGAMALLGLGGLVATRRRR